VSAPLLLMVAGLAGAAEPPVATLRLGVELTTLRAEVRDTPRGTVLRLLCEADCPGASPGAVLHEEETGHSLLGLFQLWDGDNLLISTWAAASVYFVRVHHLNPRGATRVLEQPSRSAPALRLDARGRMVVRTTERTGGPSDPLRVQDWRWNGRAFRRLEQDLRMRNRHSSESSRTTSGSMIRPYRITL